MSDILVFKKLWEKNTSDKLKQPHQQKKTKPEPVGHFNLK